jgi:carboxypeptidase Taq
MMPAKGNAARAAAIAEMDALLHRLRVDPRLAVLLERADDEALDDLQRANLREMRRDWRRANAVPEALVEAKSLATSRCGTPGNRSVRRTTGTASSKTFARSFALVREEAQHRAERSGPRARTTRCSISTSPAWTGAEVDVVFGELHSWLPDLVRRVRDRQATQTIVEPRGLFAKTTQQALSRDVMTLLGSTSTAGRLDESAHRSVAAFPEDTRLTTRYREDSFLQALMGHDPPRPAMPAMSKACRASGSASRSAARARWRCMKARA